MAREALEIINRVLAPKCLNYVQELVFLQSWAGKLYREIAVESGYDLDYVKEVGSQLWSSLSEVLGQRITKKNVRLVLSNFQAVGNRDRWNTLPRLVTPIPDLLRFPGGAVPLNSNLYVDRPPIEEQVYAEIARPGSLIRIRAPKQMGKSSLVQRTLAYARRIGLNTVMLSFQQADSAVFTNLNQFMRWFCLNVGRQLQLESHLNDYWDSEIGSKVSSSIYFQEYLLEQCQGPVVLALDEMNRVLEYPALVQDFLPLLRAWHEEAAESEIWQKLRLIVSHSTEVYVPIDFSQSPFNVGLPIYLPEFSLEQVQELAARHGLRETEVATEDLQALMKLVGGHPYLVRLALYWVKQREISLTQLLHNAPTQAGIYSTYLRRHWRMLQQHPDLWIAFREVVASQQPIQLEAIIAYHLESMGLIRLDGNAAMPSCDLYRLYFSSQRLNKEMEATIHAS